MFSLINQGIHLQQLRSKKVLKVFRHSQEDFLLDFLTIVDFDSDESRLVIVCKGLLYERNIFSGDKKFEAIMKTIQRCKRFLAMRLIFQAKE